MENERKMVSLWCSTIDFNETWMLTKEQLDLLVALADNDLLQDSTDWSIVEKRNIKVI